jgi:membrane associated rhomboid family serine protease
MSWRPEWEEGPPRRMGFGGTGGGSFFAVAPIARTLLLLCIGVTVFSAISRNWIGADPLEPWLALTPQNAKFVYPFFTYVLPHSTYDAWHIVLNMVMFWYLGQELEVRLGRTRFLTLFFGAAVFGAIAFVLLAVAMSLFTGSVPSYRLMGASGGIFALIFYIARESPSRPFFLYFIAVPARVLAFILVVLEIWPIIFGASDGVAHSVHLAGAGFGWVYQRHPFDAFALVGRWREAARARAVRREQRVGERDDAEVDRLLRKIHDQGMPSLTPAERRFLDERSRSLRGDR